MKRVSIFCGHYGSGKTNIAVNYAKFIREQGFDTALADIDIVNPYFRSKDSERELTDMGIRVISLPFANTNVDLPSLPSEVYSLVQNRKTYAVFEVGGDDRGAYALGRYVPYILDENNYEMFFVVNFFRPLTRTAGDALAVLREIETACGIPFTAIVNNSNLGEQTTADDIGSTLDRAKELSGLCGLPVKFTCAQRSISAEDMFPLDLQKKYF